MVCINLLAGSDQVCTIHTIKRPMEGVMRSREVIELIVADGWYEVEVKGSHHQFKHPTKKGRVTVPHPKSDLPVGTVHSILKQAGLK
jgi:predicted RNA binding protein YcfA (HicA-like mRNA interferase family)